MTKLLPIGFIKENSDISWRTFNLLLEKVNLDDQIGQLYVVDIEFDHKKAIDNQIVYNKIYPRNIEKQKFIDPCERYVYQLIEQYSAMEKGNSQKYRATKKAQATLFKKNFVIKRAGWHLTKLYSLYTFEQECFKKDFISKNQTSRQDSKNLIEKNFFKLMNNSNFGCDCRNNLDNCQFVPIFDELKEMAYLIYYNYFDSKVSNFVSSDLIKQEIEEKYSDMKINMYIWRCNKQLTR